MDDLESISVSMDTIMPKSFRNLAADLSAKSGTHGKHKITVRQLQQRAVDEFLATLEAQPKFDRSPFIVTPTDGRRPGEPSAATRRTIWLHPATASRVRAAARAYSVTNSTIVLTALATLLRHYRYIP